MSQERSRGRFSQSERALEKSRSRAADVRAVDSGVKSLDELKQENGHFAGLNVRMDLSRAKALY